MGRFVPDHAAPLHMFYQFGWCKSLRRRQSSTERVLHVNGISAYTCSTHTNLAVRKIMDVMRAPYAKSCILSQHVSNYTWDKRSRKAREYCERKACIVCEQHFIISLNRLMVIKMLEMRHWFLYFVGTHFRMFPPLCSVTMFFFLSSEPSDPTRRWRGVHSLGGKPVHSTLIHPGGLFRGISSELRRGRAFLRTSQPVIKQPQLPKFC